LFLCGADTATALVDASPRESVTVTYLYEVPPPSSTTDVLVCRPGVFVGVWGCSGALVGVSCGCVVVSGGGCEGVGCSLVVGVLGGGCSDVGVSGGGSEIVGVSGGGWEVGVSGGGTSLLPPPPGLEVGGSEGVGPGVEGGGGD
jgi:hypothetical protein